MATAYCRLGPARSGRVRSGGGLPEGAPEHEHDQCGDDERERPHGHCGERVAAELYGPEPEELVEADVPVADGSARPQTHTAQTNRLTCTSSRLEYAICFLCSQPKRRTERRRTSCVMLISTYESSSILLHRVVLVIKSNSCIKFIVSTICTFIHSCLFQF